MERTMLPHLAMLDTTSISLHIRYTHTPVQLLTPLSVYGRDRQLWSWRAGVLQSLAPPTLIKHTVRSYSMSTRSLDSYRHVCLVRVGAKLCRTPKLPIPGVGYKENICHFYKYFHLQYMVNFTLW